ncbi:MAG: DUF4153 domain-containing protein [Gammaproteobacteria bacterium]|nr:DUF4153 domain-containing protein [Gammaproteobacteria bacterium]
MPEDAESPKRLRPHGGQRRGIEMQANGSLHPPRLPVILAAAVIQGWALYGLHHAITTHTWPATHLAWLFGFYAVAVLIPVTTQLLVEWITEQATWFMVAVLTVAFFYFGWHHGSAVANSNELRFAASGECFPLAAVLIVLWLHLLPFIQARLELGKWSVQYEVLFAHAWRNVVALAEAGVFTGLFWLLLFLWQTLFHMLQIDFFRDLFQEPIFVYPVTSLVFGSALHLIGSVERLVSTVLEQILNVFKWLGTVTGVLLALFTLALLTRLPGLLHTGEKAIGASWLLWLVAVVVLFLNAAFRDGKVQQPYPRFVALALRAVMPLTVIVALTALYALGLRTREYGLTVERVWGLVVGGAALTYALGYTAAALRSGPWFAGIGRVNVVVALGLIATLCLCLTPLLSPYRLAAASQYARVLAGQFKETAPRGNYSTPFHYLRFDAGNYGRRKLDQLARLQGHPDAERIRGLAATARQLVNPWEPERSTTTADLLARMVVYPQGHALPPELRARLAADLEEPQKRYLLAQPDCPVAGLFLNLSDGTPPAEQFVLLVGGSGDVYRQEAAGWRVVARLSDSAPSASAPGITAAVQRGEVIVRESAWKDLWIGQHHLRVQ